MKRATSLLPLLLCLAISAPLCASSCTELKKLSGLLASWMAKGTQLTATAARFSNIAGQSPKV